MSDPYQFTVVVDKNNPRFRVWCLSVILSRLQPSKERHPIYKPAKSPLHGAARHHMNIMSRMSIALTRDSEGTVAAMATDLSVDNNVVTIVASPSPSLAPMTNAIDSSSQAEQATSPQKESPADEADRYVNDHHLAKISCSSIAVGAVVESSELKELYKRPMEYPQYVRACLNGIRHDAQSLKSLEAKREAGTLPSDLWKLVVSQSHKRIAAKYDAIWDRYFEAQHNSEDPAAPQTHKRLLDWGRPQPQGNVDAVDNTGTVVIGASLPELIKEWKAILGPAFEMRQCEDDTTKHEYVTEKGGMLALRDALARAMRAIKDALDACDYFKLVKDMMALRLFVKALPMYFWDDESLVDILKAIRLSENDRYASPNHDHDGENELTSEIEDPILFPDPSNRFIRDLETLTAVLGATLYLPHRRAFSLPIQFNVNIVTVPMPRITGNKDVLTETRGLLPYWTTREILDAEQHDDILQAIGDTFPRLESTACHCEAAIMALLCPHESDRTPIEIRTMFNPFKRALKYTIGVSWNCCRICMKLKNILCKERHLDLALSENHSAYTAWIPPPWLPDEIVKQVEVDLLADLKGRVDLLRHDRKMKEFYEKLDLEMFSLDSTSKIPWI